MNITLYHATALAALSAHIDHDTGEINIEAFEAAQHTAQERQLAYAAMIRNDDAAVAALKEVERELSTKRKAVETRQERMRQSLVASMKATNTTKLHGDRGTFTVSLFEGRDKSVQIEPGAVFSPELCNDPKPPEPSKSKIKAAILAGQEVQGAHIVANDRLEIK